MFFIVTEIDADMFQTFIWWRHVIKSGFDFCSCGHLISACPRCIFPCNLVQIYVSSLELLIFFSKIKMAVVAILDLLESATKLHSSCATPVKVSSWSAKWFSSYKDLNYFLSFMFESPIHTPTQKIGLYNSLYYRTSRVINIYLSKL